MRMCHKLQFYRNILATAYRSGNIRSFLGLLTHTPFTVFLATYNANAIVVPKVSGFPFWAK